MWRTLLPLCLLACAVECTLEEPEQHSSLEHRIDQVMAKLTESLELQESLKQQLDQTRTSQQSLKQQLDQSLKQQLRQKQQLDQERASRLAAEERLGLSKSAGIDLSGQVEEVSEVANVKHVKHATRMLPRVMSVGEAARMKEQKKQKKRKDKKKQEQPEQSTEQSNCAHADPEGCGPDAWWNGGQACRDPSVHTHYWVKQHCKKLCDPTCHAESCIKDYSKLEDAEYCKDPAECVPGHKYYMYAMEKCKHLCGLSCASPEVTPRQALGLINHMPFVEIDEGHRHCKDKFSVWTLAGDTRHFAVPESRRVSVCGTCINDQYLLHPAYGSGGKVFGVCVPIKDDHLMKTLIQRNTEMKPTCLKFVSGNGMFMAPDGMGKHSADGGQGNHPTNQKSLELFAGEHIPENTAGAFTCIEVAKKNWFQDTQNLNLGKGNKHLFGIVFTSLTRKLVECHSTEEVFKGRPKMKCVKHKQQILCKRKRLMLEKMGDYSAARKEAFKEDPTSWDDCASFDQDIAASF